MEQPPLIPAEPLAANKIGLGRIGLFISMAPLVALGAMLLAKPG
jgi:hypothetical protein